MEENKDCYPITDYDVIWQNIILNNIKNEKTARNRTVRTSKQTCPN